MTSSRAPTSRRCVDCDVELVKPAMGRPPIRCPGCRRKRRHVKQPQRRVPLAVVRDALPVGGPAETPAVEPEASAGRGALSAVVRRDLAGLDSDHPLAASLAAGAEQLAALFDGPVSAADPRAAAALWREIRGTLDALARVEAPDDGDADLFGDLSAPVVVAPPA